MFVDVIREFIAEHSCTLGNESLWSVAHRKYKQMDADGNGTLDRDEFASLIADGNETLDRDELASLMKELSGSKTISANKVNYLFGKFEVSENNADPFEQ